MTPEDAAKLAEIKSWLHAWGMRVVTDQEWANRNGVAGFYLHTEAGKEAMRAAGYVHSSVIKKRLAAWEGGECDCCRRLANSIISL